MQIELYTISLAQSHADSRRQDVFTLFSRSRSSGRYCRIFGRFLPSINLTPGNFPPPLLKDFGPSGRWAIKYIRPLKVVTYAAENTSKREAVPSHLKSLRVPTPITTQGVACNAPRSRSALWFALQLAQCFYYVASLCGFCHPAHRYQADVSRASKIVHFDLTNW